ncbi:MAG TPA: hypothetical protein VF252_11280 [Gemmatimonadales bacterium]
MACFHPSEIVGRTFATLLVAALVGPAPMAAQVGIASNVAEVALLVRVPLEASVQSVGPVVRSSGSGQVTEASVKVRLSINTAYRLVAVGLPSRRGTRMWVRSSTGGFQELTPGAEVTVMRESRTAGLSEREVSYRIESAAGNQHAEALPVRYEVVINPAI